MKYINYILGFFYSQYLRLYDIKIHPFARISRNCVFEGLNKVNRGVRFVNSYLGKGSYINNDSFFVSTKIGRFCSIGSDVKVIIGSHPLGNNVSTHPCFYSVKEQAGFTFSKKQLFEEQKYADKNEQYYVIIENDVWIGSNVTILSGVTIKNGAVVASGSVVTKDIEPYAVVGGVPAKTIKNRFSDEDVKFLLESMWWNKSIDWIKENYLKFSDIDLYKNIDENSY